MELGFGIIVGCVIFMAIKLHKIEKKLNLFHEHWFNQENKTMHSEDDRIDRIIKDRKIKGID